MYLSESEGEYYTCACKNYKYHSYLLSSRDGIVYQCCKEKGWDTFTYHGIVCTKNPDQTYQEVKDKADTYAKWCRETDWDEYHRNNVKMSKKGE